MTREELISFVKNIYSLYPTKFKSNAEVQNYVNVVEFAYSTIPLDKAMVALQDFVMNGNSAFPPEPAQIIGIISRLDAKVKEEETRPADALEAWNHVYKAICNSTWHHEEEWCKLSELEKAAVGAPGNLESWAKMDSGTVHTVVQANFIKAYKELQQRAKSNLMLPQQVQKKIAEIGESKPIKALVQQQVAQIATSGVPMPDSARKRLASLGYEF